MDIKALTYEGFYLTDYLKDSRFFIVKSPIAVIIQWGAKDLTYWAKNPKGNRGSSLLPLNNVIK